jgi:hypothetical protein
MRGFAVLVFTGACLFATSSRAQTTDEKELKRIELETARLEQQNDAGLGEYLADDWTCVGMRNLSKTEFLQNVKHSREQNLFSPQGQPAPNPYTIEKKDLQVRVFGDTAVVTYIKEYRQTPDTSKFFSEDDTDVFTRDVSGWQLHYTRIYPVQTQSAAN